VNFEQGQCCEQGEGGVIRPLFGGEPKLFGIDLEYLYRYFAKVLDDPAKCVGWSVVREKVSELVGRCQPRLSSSCGTDPVVRSRFVFQGEAIG
jgi:hypothetical protein